MNNSETQVLVVGPSWVGDMVMAQSLFKVLKAGQPMLKVSVLAPEWSRPLLDRMPEVEASINFPLRHGELNLSRRRLIARQVRSHGFAQAIVLPNSFKSALLPLLAGIPLRTGWRGEFRRLLLNDCRRLDPQRYPLMVQRFVALGLPPESPLPTEIPAPALSRHADSINSTLGQLGARRSERLLAICPGAEYGEAKQWPAFHFSELCKLATATGWRVLIVGSPNDAGIAGQIMDGLPASAREHCDNLAGRTSLRQAIDILSIASAVVSNDSGLMHIAAALGGPVVAIYGSTSADFTPPLSKRVKSVFKVMDCRPCFQRRCPLGHLRCLKDLEAEEVFTALCDLVD
ncbi:MAG: lipopolysaccharide heptosyltransferase II [Pseudohongiellaceae bacterium]